MPAKNSPSVDDKLDVIIHYLDKMDKRDRLRMAGGFIRGMITIIPVIIIVWSSWYFAMHWDEILRQITQLAAQSAAEMTQNQGGVMMEQFKLMFPGS